MSQIGVRRISLTLSAAFAACACPSRRLATVTAMAAPAGSRTAAPFVVAVDGVAAPSTESSKEFLLSRPSGAYTTARTACGGSRLFEWDTHVRRTAASIASMLGSSGSAELKGALATPDALRLRLDVTVAAAVREFKAAHGLSDARDTDAAELKVTILVTWDEEASGDGAGGGMLGSVACHIAPLPRLPAPPVRVEVRGAPRENAAAKDSAWVSERAPLEALMRSADVGGDVNELLLTNEAGEIYEGSQTNFFAIVDGAVHTAGEGVLEGTVRRLLLEVCEREGVPVHLTPPVLAQAATWDAALISSTSRLLLPIDELYAPAEGLPSGASDLLVRFDNSSTGRGALAQQLREMVQSEVEAHSAEFLT